MFTIDPCQADLVSVLYSLCQSGGQALRWFLFLVVVTGLLSCSQDAAQPVISVDDAWVRLPVPGQSVVAAYAEITNSGTADCELVAVGAEISGRVEIHQHIHNHETGMMQMRKVERLDVTAGKATILAPGGYHIMMFDLQRSVAEGDQFWLRFDFAACGSAETTVQVLGTEGK